MAELSRPSRKLTILFLILILIVSVGAFNYAVTQTRTAVRETTREQLRSLAAVVATQVDGDTLKSLEPGDETTPAFLAIRDQLYAMEKANPDIEYIYTMRLVNGSVQFVVDADYGMKPDAARIGTPYYVPSAEMLQGFSGNTAEREFTTDQWGTTLSGYAPVRNSNGAVVAIAGVDMSADRVVARMDFLGEILYILVICIMAGIGAAAIGIEVMRTRTEEAVGNSERTMRGIFNNVYDAIFLHDVNGRIIDVNDQMLRLYGVSREEAVKMSLENDLSAPSAPLADLPVIWKEVLAGNQKIFEWRARRPGDGSEFDIEVVLRAIRLDNRDVILATVRDITERKRSQEAIRLVSEKLSLMNSVTRHDISNQLTVVRGYLELLKDDPGRPDRFEFLTRMERATHNIEGVIAFSRDYQNIGVQAPRWQDVREVILKGTGSIRQAIPIFLVDLRGIEVFADLLLEKAFFNLVENTIRHGGPSCTTVRFSSMTEGDGLVLVCEDNGTGIREDEKELVFSREFGKHTGLGLFLVREILMITGISIRETGEYGSGARFEILVPGSAWRQLREP